MNQKEQPKVGIIGCGARMEMLLKIAAAEGVAFNVGALCDPNPERIQRFTEMLGTQPRVYATADELVQDADIDWVAIASWNAFHAGQTMAALRNGKHVLCDKPVATSMDDCVALKRAQVGHPQHLIIGFTLRYTWHYRTIKERIARGDIGDIVSFECNENLDFCHGGHIMTCWRSQREFTGCHILEKCCHDIDLIHWVTASRPTRVASFGGLNFFHADYADRMEAIPPRHDGLPPYSARANPFLTKKDIVDNQVAILEFENGARGTFHTNLNAGFPERRMYVLGTEGAIRADLVTGTIEICRIGYDEPIERLTGKHIGGHGGGDEVLIDHWSKVIRGEEEPFTNLDAGLASAITCLACDEAMQTGTIVNLSPYWEQLDTIVSSGHERVSCL